MRCTVTVWGACDSLLPVVEWGARRAGVQESSPRLDEVGYRAGANGQDSLQDSLLLFFELLTQSVCTAQVPSGTLAAMQHAG